MATIGDRALQRLKELSPPPKHRDVADSIGMTADAFSRALSGKRQFSSIELARLADRIDAEAMRASTRRQRTHSRPNSCSRPQS